MRVRRFLFACFFVVCALVLAQPAGAVPVFGYDFQLNGDASATSSTLQLTQEDVFGDRASAFIRTPVTLGPTTSFEARFSFRILGGTDGADGFTFTLQSDERGPGFLGISGGNVGFYTIAGADGRPLRFGPARGVAFDTFRNVPYGDADDNHVSTIDDTSYLVRRQAPAPVDLNSGDEYFAWVSYEGAAKVLSVYLGTTDLKPDTALLVDSMDLYSELGSEVFAGFTAATGGLTNAHVITSFALGPTPANAPEPDVVLLVGAALLALALGRRHVFSA